MLLNCGVGEDYWESLELKGDPTSPPLGRSVLNIHWNSNTLATWCKELTHLKRLWCWERLKAGGSGWQRMSEEMQSSCLSPYTWRINNFLNGKCTIFDKYLCTIFTKTCQNVLESAKKYQAQGRMRLSHSFWGFEQCGNSEVKWPCKPGACDLVITRHSPLNGSLFKSFYLYLFMGSF